MLRAGPNTSALTDGGKVRILKPGAATTTTTAAGAADGFNAAKTAFTLPHNLGLLPGGELALAKTNPPYAKGLANPADWAHSSSTGTLVAPWYFVGQAGAKAAVYGGEIVNEKNYFSGVLETFVPSGYVWHGASFSINVSGLNSIPNSIPSHTISPTTTPDILQPSALEFEAAPVGTLDTQEREGILRARIGGVDTGRQGCQCSSAARDRRRAVDGVRHNRLSIRNRTLL